MRDESEMADAAFEIGASLAHLVDARGLTAQRAEFSAIVKAAVDDDGFIRAIQSLSIRTSS